MKKIYTFVRKQATLGILSLTLLSSSAFGQSLCGPIVENFNATGGTTAGFSGDFSFQTNRLNKQNVVATAVYSITSPTYTLANVESTLGYGFVLQGTEQVSRVTVKAMYISTLTNTMQIVEIGNFVPNYGGTNSATICSAVALNTLPGFPAGGAYRFQLDFVSSTGAGGAGSTISFDDFRTNGTLSLAPLPVVFVGFDVRKAASGVQLIWKVGGEENVARYEVEKSTDGRSFTTLATVSKTGRDTYTYLDANNNGTAYYRIRNVDNDGKFKYSTIARIIDGKTSIVLKVFPQPVLNQLTVQHPVITGNGLISVSGADGRVIKSLKPAIGSMQTYIDMNSLQKGMYMIRFDAGNDSVETMKVIKQ
ncbi:MAG TPA: T9SS type A sorting domain-containing protein [Chitinophagaceae bacterium]|nr:T9SS type A sorting domain-containing protein [Chitinophagaceae bacterium]